jgi:plasmid stabilization system protein ParE
MKRTLILEPEAIADLEDARRWYNSGHPGLGEQFLEEAEKALDFVAKYPLNLPVVYRDLRLNRVRRFPYIVVYRVRADYIYVLAVWHTHRDPSGWQSRG